MQRYIRGKYCDSGPFVKYEDAEKELNIVRKRIKELEEQVDAHLRLMDNIREVAKGRNPGGATILDFMAVWNEQYSDRIKEQEKHIQAQDIEIKELQRHCTFYWMLCLEIGEGEEERLEDIGAEYSGY